MWEGGAECTSGSILPGPECTDGTRGNASDYIIAGAHNPSSQSLTIWSSARLVVLDLIITFRAMSGY